METWRGVSIPILAYKKIKPKPGNQSHCEKGFDPTPFRLNIPKIKIDFRGTKKVGDKTAFVVRLRDPRSTVDDIYYFDVQTYLLLRSETTGLHRVEVLYSDYRDVNGLKIPFMIIRRSEYSQSVTTVREAEINGPIEDARFEKPNTRGGQPLHDLRVRGESPPLPPPAAPHRDSLSLPGSPGSIAGAALGPPPMDAAQTAAYVSATSFASCPSAQLQGELPELDGLKVASSQEGLPALLDKIGDKTEGLFRKTPDLISHEQVVASQPGRKATRRNFSYLILSHRSPDAVTLEEFRMDLPGPLPPAVDARNVGPAASTSSSAFWDGLRSSSQQASARETGTPPLTQGFAYMWVHFYPSNRSESNFRYLGRQKIDRHNTLVVAFSQKPAAVRMPGELRFEGKSIPVLYQGIAWVDASDFRIVRLRTDLLLPLTDAPVSQLTAEIHFVNTPVSGVASPLWLPHEVVVTSNVNGFIFLDRHTYSNYRLYAAQSRMVLNP
jgi:hypothetical protein